jgi:D-alanyl-D-alanine carboxypeptidase
VKLNMFFRLLITALLCCLLATSCTTISGLRESNPQELPYAAELQGAIERAVASAESDVELGVSAAVIAPGYNPWRGVSGLSQPGVPITADMLFDAGSIEKNFEAALVLQLAEEGRLSLDDPVSKYLPPYPNVDGRITLRQLLNHTSGVFNVFEHPDFPWVGTDVDYSKRWTLDEVFSNFVSEPYGPPGYAQHYSSTNTLLLTAIIEDVVGACVPKQIDARFLKPMGLEDTFTGKDKPPESIYSVAHPWVDIDGDGVLDDLYGVPLAWKTSLTHPVIFSTASDLAAWMNALYHERTVLSAESLQQMLTYPETTLRDPEGAIYGLGVVDYTDLLGVRAYGHAGSSLGYSGAALYLPDYGISLAWLINTGESPPGLADRIMRDAWASLWEVIRTKQEPLPR